MKLSTKNLTNLTIIFSMFLVEECLTLFYNSNIFLLILFFFLVFNVLKSAALSFSNMYFDFIYFFTFLTFSNFKFFNSLRLSILFKLITLSYIILNTKLLKNIESLFIARNKKYLDSIFYHFLHFIKV